MDLVEEVYRLTKRLPPRERRALADQMRRAAVSIPSNIAEGNARSHRRDYLRFLSIARGSEAELRTLIILTLRIGYATPEEVAACRDLLEQVGRMLTRLIAVLAVGLSPNRSRVPSP